MVKDIEPPKTIEVEGLMFDFIKTRAHTPFSIYKGGDLILRIGPKEIVTSELRFHRNLLDLEFPVAEIISEGENNGQYYYIETSLGDQLLADIFWEDFKNYGRVLIDFLLTSDILIFEYVYLFGRKRTVY